MYYKRSVSVLIAIIAAALSACKSVGVANPEYTTTTVALVPTTNPTITPIAPGSSVPTLMAPAVTATNYPPLIRQLINLENAAQVQPKAFYISSTNLSQLVIRTEVTWVVEPIPDEGIEIRDFYTHDLIKLLKQGDPEADLIIVSSAGHRMASVSPEHGIDIWNLDTFEWQINFPFQALSGYDMVGAFSTDEKLLAVAGCHRLDNSQPIPLCDKSSTTIYDLSLQAPLQVLDGYQKDTWALAFNSTGTLLALTGQQEALFHADLLVWNIEHNAQAVIQMAEVDSDYGDISFNTTSDMLATIHSFRSGVSELAFWDVTTQHWTRRASSPGGPIIIRYLPKAPSLLVTADGLSQVGITFWNAETGLPIHFIPTQWGAIFRLGIGPDGQQVYTWFDDLGGGYRIQQYGLP